MRDRNNTLKEELTDVVVRVEVSMSWRFLKKIDAHRERLAEKNRSAWVRQACLKLMREEQQDLGEDDDGL